MATRWSQTIWKRVLYINTKSHNVSASCTYSPPPPPSKIGLRSLFNSNDANVALRSHWIRWFYFICYYSFVKSINWKFYVVVVFRVWFRIAYSLRFDWVEIYWWAACHAFSLQHSACEALYSELVWLPHPFWEKSGKYYFKKHGKLMELWKERTIIALGFIWSGGSCNCIKPQWICKKLSNVAGVTEVLFSLCSVGFKCSGARLSLFL